MRQKQAFNFLYTSFGLATGYSIGTEDGGNCFNEDLIAKSPDFFILEMELTKQLHPSRRVVFVMQGMQPIVYIFLVDYLEGQGGKDALLHLSVFQEGELGALQLVYVLYLQLPHLIELRGNKDYRINQQVFLFLLESKVQSSQSVQHAQGQIQCTQ